MADQVATEQEILQQQEVKQEVAPAPEPPKEYPALFDPNIAKLCERPLILDPVKTENSILVKCIRPNGREWVQLSEQYLKDYNDERHVARVSRTTLTDVTFHSAEVEVYVGGCGGGTDYKQIGYCSGKVLSSGTLDPHAHTYVVKFDRNTATFSVDGKQIVGAEVMILGDNCIGLVINPQFK